MWPRKPVIASEPKQRRNPTIASEPWLRSNPSGKSEPKCSPFPFAGGRGYRT